MCFVYTNVMISTFQVEGAEVKTWFEQVADRGQVFVPEGVLLEKGVDVTQI